MKTKSRYNCAFCLTPISKGHFENQNGKCQRCQYYFPDSMPFQQICFEFGCTEYAQIGKEFCAMHEMQEDVKKMIQTDTRYLIPKTHHGLSPETINKAIESNDIYREVKEMMNMQMDQVGYGMTKYPELLNPMSWTMVETLEHKAQEQVDELHYTIMLKNQIIEYLKKHDIEKA